MKIRTIVSFLFVTLFLISCVDKKSDNDLKIKLEKIISTANADIGLSVIEPETNHVIAINGDKSYPMMSTFKFPIALAVFNKIENGSLSINQELFISSDELLENTWSPFKNKFSNGNVSITLEEALSWMIVESDNNITDILIRLVGDEEFIEKFIDNENIIIKNNEEDMHVDWESQFINRSTPNAYTNLLKAFSEGKILNKENTKWLYQAMVKSKTGTKRLQGKLPNVVIAQRAGTSFTNEKGITGAVNNVGIIEMPNNQKIYIAVFIYNIHGFEKGEEVIADIAKTVYEHYLKN
uniref:class A beta-lactamase n=2 Tax=Flavobacterium sp. TaxID=239 RepID=UPI00404AB434